MKTPNVIRSVLVAVAMMNGEAGAASLGPAAIVSGAARLDNGSLVTLGQPFAVVAGPGAGVVPGIIPVLQPASGQHPPFLITPLGSWSATDLSITFTGEPGRGYVLWASTDLMSWTPIQTNQAQGTTVILLDASASVHPHRFYRVSAP